MDGNGRWAAQRGQPRIAGHKAGVEAVRAAVDTGARLGLGALTLYAFSTENWKRPRYEVDALMRMLRRYLRLELDEIDRQNIKFQTIGRIGALAENVRKEIQRATEQTARNKGMVLSVALNYGGRAEIVDAARAAVRRLIDEGSRPDEFTEERIANELYTRNLPELDLLVRTSGELQNLKLSTLAERLQRDLRHRNSLARFPARPSARSRGRLPAPRPALWRIEARG